MKELNEIISCARKCPDIGALATIVQTEGSSYRRPGAHMLILPDGKTVGSISGGCLEQDVIAHARKISENGRAEVLTYDTSTEEDLIFGVGLGCKGTVRILVEPIKCANSRGQGASEFLDFAAELLHERRSGVVATVFAIDGSSDLKVGARIMMDASGKVSGQIPDLDLQQSILEDAGEVAAKRRSLSKTYTLGNGSAEVFLAIIESPIPLVIFGAGFDALPMVRLAKEIGFHVTVADPRPAYATRARFSEADDVIVVQPENIEKQVNLNDRTAAVIMSHNYAIDRAFLNALILRRLHYLGMMGPKKRAEKMLQELRAEGLELGEQEMRRLHNPIGLDIGAEGPEQIGLAVLGEIQAVIAGHAGGMLREKNGSIHAPRHEQAIQSEQERTQSNKFPCPTAA